MLIFLIYLNIISGPRGAKPLLIPLSIPLPVSPTCSPHLFPLPFPPRVFPWGWYILISSYIEKFGGRGVWGLISLPPYILHSPTFGHIPYSTYISISLYQYIVSHLFLRLSPACFPYLITLLDPPLVHPTCSSYLFSLPVSPTCFPYLFLLLVYSLNSPNSEPYHNRYP